MKNLSELSDEQKSAMLAQLCGWKYKKRGILGNSWWAGECLIYDECYDQVVARLLDLYDTANMALAWLALNWAGQNGIMPQMDVIFKYQGDWTTMTQLPPKKAQRAWLDKILSLAIETGMLEVQNANH